MMKYVLAMALMGVGSALAATPTYTAAQASSGAAVFKAQCAACHGPKLNNGGAPHLAGADFIKKWSPNTLDDFYYLMSTTMPQTHPGALAEAQYTNTLAYILQQNGFKASTKPLSSKNLKQLSFKK